MSFVLPPVTSLGSHKEEKYWMGQHTRTLAVLLCAQLGGSENSWKCLQCLKIPQNPGGLEAGRGEESSSGLSAPVSLSLMFYASLHKSSKLLCMCASMNAVVTPSNLMCSNQMMTPEEQKLACQISSMSMDGKTCYSCVPRRCLHLAGAVKWVLQYTKVQRQGILSWLSPTTSR